MARGSESRWPDPFRRLPARERRSLRQTLARAFRDEVATQRDRVLAALRAVADIGGGLVEARMIPARVPAAELGFGCGMRTRLTYVHGPAIGELASALDAGPVRLARAGHPGPFFALYFDSPRGTVPLLASEVRVVDDNGNIRLPETGWSAEA